MTLGMLIKDTWIYDVADRGIQFYSTATRAGAEAMLWRYWKAYSTDPTKITAKAT